MGLYCYCVIAPSEEVTIKSFGRRDKMELITHFTLEVESRAPVPMLTRAVIYWLAGVLAPITVCSSRQSCWLLRSWGAWAFFRHDQKPAVEMPRPKGVSDCLRPCPPSHVGAGDLNVDFCCTQLHVYPLSHLRLQRSFEWAWGCF